VNFEKYNIYVGFEKEGEPHYKMKSFCKIKM
jgi:hypothetical protein